MPVAQNPEEHYHHYCLSQRRVERWVQETDKQLQQAAAPPVESQIQSQSHRSTPKGPHPLPSPPAQAAGDDPRPRTSHRSSSAKPHRTHAVSRSRSRPSSGSKKISSDGRKRRRRGETPLALSTYLPYGLLPLLFAVTGTTVISVLFAVVLLAGYTVSAVSHNIFWGWLYVCSDVMCA